MSFTLIVIGIVGLVIGAISLKSWLANRTIGTAKIDVAVSKKNDEERSTTVKTLTKHQKEIKETVKKTDTVVKIHRDKLLTRKEKLDARRKKNE